MPVTVTVLEGGPLAGDTLVTVGAGGRNVNPRDITAFVPSGLTTKTLAAPGVFGGVVAATKVVRHSSRFAAVRLIPGRQPGL